jgi:uncharacterized lipoprotein YbaY
VPSEDARAIVLLVEGKNGPTSGNIVTSTSMTDPGDQPIAFKLSYPMSAVTEGTPYRLYAGLIEGDLAWVTPIGVAVQVPQNAEIKGVELPLQYRPDLLKGAVTGTISGKGLDSSGNPDAYGTALVLRVDTGETIGIQVISPFGTVPAGFSVPYDPTKIDQNADYVARASVWDGTQMWEVANDEPVITKGNPKAGVSLTVEADATPSPSALPTEAPSPSPEPGTTGTGGGLPWVLLLIVAALAVIGTAGFLAWKKSQDAKQGPDSDPTPGGVPPAGAVDDVADGPVVFPVEAPVDGPAETPADDLDADIAPAGADEGLADLVADPAPADDAPADSAPADADTVDGDTADPGLADGAPVDGAPADGDTADHGSEQDRG